MAVVNHAVFLTAAKTPLAVQETPYTAPGPKELVVRNRAVAINAVDAYKQIFGDALLPYIKMPCVPGNDLAGEVVETGSDVTRFEPGDHVLAEAAGTAAFGNRPPEGAFQEYVIVREHLAAKIPDGVPFDRASTLPLSFSTAAYGLFHHSTLKLDIPTVPARPKNGQALIITSGASSLGSCAIQLAVAAGYDVYSTASPKNFDLVRNLGATAVYDYHDPGHAEAIAAKLKGTKVAGALAISASGVATSAEVLKLTDSVKFIADAGPPPPDGYPEDIECKFFVPDDLEQPDSVVPRIWRDFLPQALQERLFAPAMELLVVGKGLERIQEAYEICLKGVSAQKIVVTL